jgi:radical SAM superfamily enzyme YgiQ (UPF0313 family)
MRILFVSTNRLRRIMPPMPLGLACIAAQIDDSRHEIQVLDLMFSEDPHAELRSALSSFAPDLIALSIRNLDNQSCFQTEYYLPEARELVALCREHSGAIIVVGGGAFTANPAAAFAYLDPDFGIAGEGEIAFRELVERIESKMDWSNLPGLVWRGSEGPEHNPVRLIEDLDSLAAPRRDLFDNRRYAAEGGLGNVFGKSGCSFHCIYCDQPQVAGHRWRMRSPEKVVDELEELGNQPEAPTIVFSDAVFNHPLSHAKEICRAIIRRGLDVSWVASVNPAFLERHFVELMREAGCAAISLGADSCSQPMLKTLRKGFTVEHLRASAEILEEMQVPYMLWLLVGGPGEDRRTVDESCEFLLRRKPVMADFSVGVRIMPGTALAAAAVREGVISADDPLLEPKFYLSPGVEGWIEDYLSDLCSDRPNWTSSRSQPQGA